MKYYITDKEPIGCKGPGQYVVTETDKKTNITRVRVITYTGDECKVDQAQTSLTDVHVLLEPAIRQGLLRHSTKYEGEYDDIPFKDYNEALNIQAHANTMFEELPSKIRNRFENNPAKFLEFTQDPKNVPEMQALGMTRGVDGLTISGKPIKPEPIKSEPTTTPATAVKKETKSTE